jgi:uncharacterized protein involved in exopolysaccharide biosynthesis
LELKQLQVQLVGSISRLNTLASQKQAVLERLRKLNSDEVVISQLEMEAEVARSQWLTYTDNLEQARIDQERAMSRVSNISMAQDATLAHRPVKPSKMLVLLASLALAGAGTVAAVAASERSHQLRERALREFNVRRDWQRAQVDSEEVSRVAAPR